MRKIHFRGFCPDLGRWLYGDLFHCGNRLISHYTKLVPIVAIVQDDGTAMEVDPKSVGQLTERVDCKGNVIYEGDRLICLTNGVQYVVRWTSFGFSAQYLYDDHPFVINYDLGQLLLDRKLVNLGPEYKPDKNEME